MGIGDGKARDIFALFLTEKELLFGDIERLMDMRSNLLAYHLKQMVDDGVLEKDGLSYRLTKSAETLIPYFQQMTGKEQLKLPVVVLALRRQDGRFALIHRKHRPYLGYWAVPGSKWRMGETIEEATTRVARDECGIVAGKMDICTVIDEHLKDDAGLRNSWVMFLVRVDVGEQEGKNVRWVLPKELDDIRVIPSDKWMIKELTNDRMKLHHVRMREFAQDVSARMEKDVDAEEILAG
mgnify:CR=1 FL=1